MATRHATAVSSASYPDMHGAGITAWNADHVDTTPGLTLLKQTASLARYANPRVRDVMTVAPVVATSTTADGTLTNTYAYNDDTVGVFNFYGGKATTTASGIKLNSVTISGNYAPQVGRVETVADCTKIEFRFIHASSSATISLLRFIVDGQYVSLTETDCWPAADDNQYVSLTFADRAARNIIVEFGNATFVQAAVLPTESLSAPAGLILSAGVLGDSFTGSGGMTTIFRGYARVLGDLLGIRDLWSMGVGNTGWLNPATGQLNFRDRLSDIVTAATECAALGRQYLQFAYGGHNDVSYAGYSDAAMTAQILAFLQEFRAQSVLETVPLVFLGVNGGKHTGAGAEAVETAIESAVTQFDDDLVYFLQEVNNPNGPLIFGTGHVGATTGDGNADLYIGTDGTHPPDAGHNYTAARKADQVMTYFGIVANI